MNSKIGQLSKIVLAHTKEVQAENEKLISLVADQVRQFKALEASMPEIKKEAFDEFYKLAGEIKGELGDIAAFNAKSAVDSHTRTMGERNAVSLGELTAKITAKLEEARKVLAEQIKPELAKQTEDSVRRVLASEEGSKRVREAIEKHAGPMLAALEAGSAFIDLYRGTFKPGTSKAKRGELWTYYGNTVLCTADTNREPVAFGNSDTLKNWVIVAASGAPGAPGAGSTGVGGSVSAWGDLTGTLSDQSDLQGALDGKATASVVSALSSNALVLAEQNWPVKTVTWATDQELTFTGGSNNAGDGVVIQANVTTLMVLTITFATATVYRNGAVSALSGTVTVPTGKHRFVFWTPDDGTTIYMEDTVSELGDPPTGVMPSTLMIRALGGNCIAQNVDLSLMSTSTTWTNGRLFMEAIWVPADCVITGVQWYQKTAGNYTGDSFNGVALFTYNADTLTQVAISANSANCWKATSDTYSSLAFTSTYNAKAGLYFIGALYHQASQTTAPALGSCLASVAAAVQEGPGSNARRHPYNNSQTSMPSTVTLSTVNGTSLSPIWLSVY